MLIVVLMVLVVLVAVVDYLLFRHLSASVGSRRRGR